MVELSRLMTGFNLRIFEILVNKSFSVRDLAKEIGCSPAKITQFVKLFGGDNLINIKPKKNMKIVELNRKNPLTKEIVSLVFIKKILESRSFSELKKNSKAIGVFGSVVEGSVDKHSDIDIWILSGKKIGFGDSAEISAKISKELGKETNLKFLTYRSLEKLKARDKIFYRELEYKSKILHGEKLG